MKPDEKTVRMEVTWTPKDQEAGKEDIKQSIEFDPEDEIEAERENGQSCATKQGYLN